MKPAPPKELSKERRGVFWFEEILHDLRFGLRMLRKNPGFTAVTVMTLGIGIGATTAIFSIVNGVVLRPLPYPESGQLVAVFENKAPKFDRIGVAAQSYAEWKKQATVLQSCTVFQNIPFVLTGSGEAVRRFGFMVTPEYFTVYGVQPLLGRTIQPDDAVKGRDNVTVLNYKLWASQFNQDPGVIGRKIVVNGNPYTVVGVMPRSFMPESMTDPWLFVPLVLDQVAMGQNYQGHYRKSVARLKPGRSLDEATSELKVIAERLAAQFPDTQKGLGVTLVPLLENQIGNVRPLLLILLGAVGFLLLIACVNVANLLLARASTRAKEVAVRAALGASRGRIIRQLLCESLLIAGLGGALGIGLAYAGKDFLLSFAPIGLPRANQVAIDGTALLFTGGLCLFTGLGFGLAPALQATRAALPEAMKDGGRGASDGSGRTRLRSLLVVLEVSLALVLMINAGLLVLSFRNLMKVDRGFEVGRSVTYSSSFILTNENYGTPEKLAVFAERAVERISAVPGVEAATLATAHPMFFRRQRAVVVEGRPAVQPSDLPVASYFLVTPAYFGIFRIRLRDGRLFDAHDRAGSARVAIVSEGFVRKNFPAENPLGKRIQTLGNPEWMEIVGVVHDVSEEGPAGRASVQVYEPYAQRPSNFVNLIIRLEHPVAGMRPALRGALDTIDRDLPLADMKEPMDLFWNSSIGNQVFAVFLFSVFSGVSLVLSAMGIYGVVTYSVTQRTQEIGIRMALGAQAKDILRLIFSQTGSMIGLGLVIGVAGALGVTRLIASLLFQVGAHDPLTFIGIPLLLGFVGLLSCWWPARRATKVDPMVALRHE